MTVGLIFLFVSVVLYFIIFFGISFIVNMLLRRTWLMTFLYPIFVIFIVGDSKVIQYFSNPKGSFSDTFQKFTEIQAYDIIIVLSGLAGTIVSAIVIKILRKMGYQMF